MIIKNSDIPQNIKLLLRTLIKPLHLKSLSDSYQLVDLLKTVEFFKARNLDNNQILKIAQVSGFKMGLNDSFVFHQGDEPDFLYLVIWGEVSVLLRNKKFIYLSTKLKSTQDTI